MREIQASYEQVQGLAHGSSQCQRKPRAQLSRKDGVLTPGGLTRLEKMWQGRSRLLHITTTDMTLESGVACPLF